jgi:uncharacterized protein YprB with RNaseH-like and TPR domain
MPSLTDKLKELGVQVGASKIKPPERKAAQSDIADLLPGSWEKTSRGDCFIVRKHIPAAALQIVQGLSHLPQIGIFDTPGAFAGISEVPFDQYLFIDTETTGLSGGAGTYVFLVGAAKFQNDGIHFAQFFLQDPANEPCQLAALEEFASAAKVVVSYNGKSFDLPRIRNRYMYHGWPAPLQDIYHVDLLHIVRRLWKRHLPTCSLGDIEYHLLGIERDSLDIPGWQVADKFFEYLQTQDPHPLEGVFYHNEVDVISLISLLSYISDRLSNPLKDPYQTQDDLVSIGLYLSNLDKRDLAIEVISMTLENKSLSDELSLLGLRSLAALYKSGNDIEAALPLWVKCAEKDDIHSKVELAKYYEHQEADYQEAIHWTLSAQSSLDLSDELQHFQLKNLLHRLERLKLKELKRKDQP